LRVQLPVDYFFFTTPSASCYGRSLHQQYEHKNLFLMNKLSHWALLKTIIELLDLLFCFWYLFRKTEGLYSIPYKRDYFAFIA